MSNTEKLNLKLINVPEEDEEYFNVDTHLDDNWIKVDQFAKDIDSTFNDPASGVLTRLNAEKNQSTTLAPGVSTTVASKNANLKLSNISGRALFNLLYRDGDCESLAPWTFTGGSGSLDTTNRLYGSNAIKITLSSSSAKMTKTFSVLNGKRYILIADLKNGNSSNVTVSSGALGGNVLTGTTYQTSYLLFTASSNTDIQIGVSVNGSSGQVAYVDGIRIYELNVTDYNIADNTLNATQIGVKYPYTSGFAGVLNPFAIRWSSPLRETVAAMLILQTELFADPVGATLADTVSQTPEGRYIKTSFWKKQELPGSLPWFFNNNGASGSGVKRVGVPIANDWSPFSNGGSYSFKYDGKPLAPQLSNSTTPVTKDAITFWNNGNLYIDIANADSGWAENYNPSVEEVKAFMYGWRMYTMGQDAYINQYNGSGTKGWAKIGYPSTGEIPANAYNSTVPSELGFVGTTRPYFTIYQLRTPRSDFILSEGSLSILEGSNTIEVGSGIVVRERVSPFKDDAAWNINNGSPSTSGFEYATSLTKQRIDKFVGIYKNSKLDVWTLYPNNITVAGALAQQSFIAYDPLAVYSVSYIPFNRMPSSNIQFSYAINEKSILKDLINLTKNNESRVSVLENTKNETDLKINWIYPTLVNGWSNISGRIPLSYSIQAGVIHLRGEVKGGLLGNPVCYLPEGIRPANTAEYVVFSWSGSAVVPASIVILKEGAVQIQNGNNNQISIGEVIFAPS